MAEQFLRAIGNAYLVLFVIAVGLALWLPKRPGAKAAAGLAAAIVLGWPIISGFVDLQRQEREAVVTQKAVDVAYARFTARCKSAGNRIVRTVDNVEGVMLLKLRPPISFADEANPMWPGAAMAAEASGEFYIRTFIDEDWNTQVFDEKSRKIRDVFPRKPRPRYRYVDFVDANDNERYRETVDYEPIDPKAGTPWARKRAYKRALASGPPPRYAIDFEDIVDVEDRKMWIAGTIIRIVDQQTGEVIAEQTRYVMDGGQGSTGAVRTPWTHAGYSPLKCPSVVAGSSANTRTRDFVNQVLIPIQGE